MSNKENTCTNLLHCESGKRAILRAAALEQVGALLPGAPSGFVAAWEQLEDSKVDGMQSHNAEARYRQRIFEVKRGLRANPKLAETVAAGLLTPTWLADASGDALACSSGTAQPKAKVLAEDVAASRRHQLQYLRELTARSPGDVDYDSDLDFTSPARRDSIRDSMHRRSSILTRRKSRRESRRDSVRSRRLSEQSPGRVAKLIRRLAH